MDKEIVRRYILHKLKQIIYELTYMWISHLIKRKQKTLTDKKISYVVTRGRGLGGRDVIKRYIQYKYILARDVLYNMITIANIDVYIIHNKLLRESIPKVFTTRRKYFPFFFFSFYCPYMRRWLIAEPIVIISQDM